MKRRAQSIVVAAGLLVGLLVLPFGGQVDARASAGPDGDALVGFGQGVYDVTVGDDFSVVMIVAYADALGGWETILDYDPLVVRLNGLSAGAFLTSEGREAALLGPDDDPVSGQAALGGYSWGTADGVSGNGEIAVVGLHAVQVGETILDLTDTVLASVYGASVTVQPAEAHAVQVNVWAAPSAPVPAIAADGGDVEIAWQLSAGTDYEVWKSPSPDFTPGEGELIASGPPFTSNCTVAGDTVTCTDDDALSAPGQFFYIVQGLNPAGAGALSHCMGAFSFALE